ncbi:hypothetical protein DL93DRAFT_1718653 [Clavulina sp. PMI_390]|nr:hypothetical protein DL93DRAFT_1718653 [Clavulina sp. PMI_390]
MSSSIIFSTLNEFSIHAIDLEASVLRTLFDPVQLCLVFCTPTTFLRRLRNEKRSEFLSFFTALTMDVIINILKLCLTAFSGKQDESQNQGQGQGQAPPSQPQHQQQPHQQPQPHPQPSDGGAWQTQPQHHHKPSYPPQQGGSGGGGQQHGGGGGGGGGGQPHKYQGRMVCTLDSTSSHLSVCPRRVCIDERHA